MNYQDSAIRGRRITTLPSVEGGFGTMNIARDPPKSVFARYKPNIFETTQITDLIDGSGDRICEGINHYARGRDPMIGVSFSNNGTNGGQMRMSAGQAGSQTNAISGRGTQAFLPFRVAKDGAFRPPIIPPQQELALSRQARKNTQHYVNLGNQFTKDLTKCGNVDFNSLRNSLLKACDTKLSFIIETPIEQPNETKAHIKSSSLQGNMTTNKHDIQATPAETFLGNQNIRIADRVHGQMTSNIKGIDKHEYIHKETQLQRNTPVAELFTNKVNLSYDLNSQITDRNYKQLPVKQSRGSMSNEGFRPSGYRQAQNITLKKK